MIGSNKFKKDIKNKLSNKPLLLCGKEMKQSEKYTYLGDELSDRGLSHSVMSTIDKRYGKVYKAIFEINIIISDVRSCVPGAFSTAMMLWNMSVLPALYSSAGCWMKLPAAAVQKLNKLSQLFLSTVLQAGPKCPIPALYWYTGSLLPINKIIEEKVLLLRHVANLGSTTLAAEVLAAQRQLELANTLWSEGSKYLRELQISVSDLTFLSKTQFKTKLRRAIEKKNKRELLGQIREYKKIDHWKLKDEPFELKKYFTQLTLKDARVKFSLDTKMLRGIKAEFSSDPQNEAELWVCDFCLRAQSLRHMEICPYFERERQNRALNDVKDLVSYFKDIMTIRMEEDRC